MLEAPNSLPKNSLSAVFYCLYRILLFDSYYLRNSSDPLEISRITLNILPSKPGSAPTKSRSLNSVFTMK